MYSLSSPLIFQNEPEPMKQLEYMLHPDTVIQWTYLSSELCTSHRWVAAELKELICIDHTPHYYLASICTCTCTCHCIWQIAFCFQYIDIHVADVGLEFNVMFHAHNTDEK